MKVKIKYSGLVEYKNKGKYVTIPFDVIEHETIEEAIERVVHKHGFIFCAYYLKITN